MNKVFMTDGYGTILRCTNKIYEIKNLIIPSEIDGETIIAIDEDAFRECYNLVTVSIPDTVTEIGKCAFDGCTSLESIILPEGLSEIRRCTFLKCKSLKYVSIPEGVIKIETAAFKYCDALSTALFKGTKLDWSVMEVGYMNQKLEDCISIASAE